MFSQALQARRAKCEHQDRDPIVWTSHRVIKWIKDIDLKVGGSGSATGHHGTLRRTLTREIQKRRGREKKKRLCVPQEFADNLRGKGVHGALMALDPSFDTDALAKALGVPGDRHMLQQHLYEEMRSLAVLHRYQPPPASSDRPVDINNPELFNRRAALIAEYMLALCRSI